MSQKPVNLFSNTAKSLFESEIIGNASHSDEDEEVQTKSVIYKMWSAESLLEWRGGAMLTGAHSAFKETAIITSSKNKMQNNALYKATKNKTYVNAVNVCLNSNKKALGFNTVLILKLSVKPPCSFTRTEAFEYNVGWCLNCSESGILPFMHGSFALTWFNIFTK